MLKLVPAATANITPPGTMQTDTVQNRMAQAVAELCVCAEDTKRLRFASDEN
jgi:hypothetical protein